MAQLVTSMSGVVLGGIMVMGLNLSTKPNIDNYKTIVSILLQF